MYKQAAFLIILGLSSSIYAAGGESIEAPTVKTDSVNEIFTNLDTNQDGTLSLEEAKASSELSTQFTELDVDANGQLSLNEFNSTETK